MSGKFASGDSETPTHPFDLNSIDTKPIDEFRTQHRTAVLVILFTDLQGSTELAERKGELYSQRVRQRHDEMLREIIQRDNAGTCIKNIGDSLMCIFAEPTSAVERAVEIQEKLSEYNHEHSDETGMEVRIGLHMGQVVVEDDLAIDVFGRHVNRAARIESLAMGGQILLTAPVYDSASGWLKERGLVWSDHGRYHLKGIHEPTQVYEVCAPGATPSRPRGKRIHETSWMAWAAALILVAAVIPAVWFLRPATAPLEASLRVRVRRGAEMYVSLNDALPLRTNDQLQLIGELSRPAYASIVWVDSQGAVHVVVASNDERVKKVSYPPEDDTWVTLEGAPGTEMLLLLTSEQPMSDIGGITRRLQADGPFPKLQKPGAIWLNSESIEQVAATLSEADQRKEKLLRRLAAPSRAPGKITHSKSESPDYRADRIRQVLHEKSASFHGVVVSHF